MNLKKSTIEVLRNFNGINQGILFREGNTIRTMSVMRTIFASAKVEDTFPKEFAIYDLGEFLSTISLFDTPDIQFKDEFFIVAEGTSKVKYFYSNPNVVVSPPEKNVAMPDADVTFNISRMQIDQLLKASAVMKLKDFAVTDQLWFTVMDAETFGHHRVGHEKLLFELLDSPFFDNRLGSDAVCDTALPSISVNPIEGTWTNDEQDTFLQKGESPFTLWDDKTNPIHKKQWELANFVVKELASFSNKELPSWQLARTQADVALASDQFWWASAKPWWSLEMIESGAFDLKQVIMTLFKSGEDKSKAALAETLYNEILAIAFEWQRSGYIRKRHSEESTTHKLPPLKDRTSHEWFNQLVLEFEKEMNDAVAKQDFERAIKWRDAVIKISLGTDKHDILHVVDELWLGRNVPWAQPQVKPFLAHSWDAFSDFAKAHFLDVSSQEEFENWQKSKS